MTGRLTNNRLRGVGDGSNNVLGVVNQTAQDNYTYDEIGNLTADAHDNIDITWTVYGKVQSVTKRDGSQRIDYRYDSQGNRTVKTVQTRNLTTNVITTKSTYYVRDAQGNVMAVYDNDTQGGTLAQKEVYLYGSSRLGIFRQANRTLGVNGLYTRSLALKEYELTDHLGNVRAVVSDFREAGTDANNPIRAALRSYANYYAFGLEMPLMNWKGDNTYRYGFNGQERSQEIADGHFTAKYWEYDSRIGRRWEIDPYWMKHYDLSPYSVLGNSPLRAIDPDGNDWYISEDGTRIQYVEHNQVPKLTLADGNYIRIGSQLTHQVIAKITGAEFSIFRSLTDWSEYSNSKIFKSFGTNKKLDNPTPWMAYHPIASYDGDRKVRMNDIFIANENINYYNFADVIMGAMIGGEGPENFYFGPEHSLSLYVSTMDVVRDAASEWWEFNSGRSATSVEPYQKHHQFKVYQAVVSILESAFRVQDVFATPEQVMGSSAVTITPILKDGTIQSFRFQVFNVTSVGSGNSQNGQSFIRPMTNTAQPYTNVSQTFEFYLTPDQMKYYRKW